MFEKKKLILLILLCLTMLVGMGAKRNENNLADDLILAIIKVESNGNPKAISPKGCRGIAQFSKEAWNEVMKEPYLPNVYDPELSKIACARYLMLLQERLGKDFSLDRLVASYNCGLARLQSFDYEWWRMGETRRYVKKVKKELERKMKGNKFHRYGNISILLHEKPERQ